MSVVLPPNLTTPADKLRALCAVAEAIRRKHNVFADDPSLLAIGHRARCVSASTEVMHEILVVRAQVSTSGFVRSIESMDPLHVTLKGEGRADYKTIDLKSVIGVDLDSMDGLGEIPDDPLQDYVADWTEDDVGGYLAVAQNRITATAQPGSALSMVYRDFGAAHFGATFEHLLDSICTVDGNDYPAMHMLCNTVEGFRDAYNNYSQAVALYYNSSTSQLKIFETEGRSNDASLGLAAARHYSTFQRTGETALQNRIYSDAGRSVLVDTIAITLTSGRRYRYGINANSYYAGGGGTMTYDVGNLDLQEGVVSASGAHSQSRSVSRSVSASRIA